MTNYCTFKRACILRTKYRLNKFCVNHSKYTSTAAEGDFAECSAGLYIVSVRPTSFACRQQGCGQGHLLDVEQTARILNLTEDIRLAKSDWSGLNRQ